MEGLLTKANLNLVVEDLREGRHCLLLNNVDVLQKRESLIGRLKLNWEEKL